MYIDNLLRICQSQDLDGETAGSVLSTYSVYLGAAKNVATGKQLYVVVTVEEAFTGCTTVDFRVVTDNIATLGTSTVIGSASGPIAVGSLTLNRVPIVIPIGNALGQLDDYIGLDMVIAGSECDSGIVSAFIAADPPN